MSNYVCIFLIEIQMSHSNANRLIYTFVCALYLNLYWVIVIWYFLNEWVRFFINQHISLLFLRDFANLNHNRNEFERVKCNPLQLIFNFYFSSQITKNTVEQSLRLETFPLCFKSENDIRSQNIFINLSSQRIDFVLLILYQWDCLSILKLLLRGQLPNCSIHAQD